MSAIILGPTEVGENAYPQVDGFSVPSLCPNMQRTNQTTTEPPLKGSSELGTLVSLPSAPRFPPRELLGLRQPTMRQASYGPLENL